MALQRLLLALCLIAVIAGGVFLFQQKQDAGDRARVIETVPARTPPDAAPPVPADRDITKLPDAPGKSAAEALPAPLDGTAPGSTGPDLSKNVSAAPEPLVAPSEAGPFDRQLGLPIVALKAADIQDTFNDLRGGGSRRHEATDIMSPRGTPVVAVDSGIVKKLFDSKVGGLTVYQFDPLEKYVYYYGHLDRYAEGLKEGMLLKRGDKVGYVGSTGDASANAPHLHFGILKMGPEKKWYADTVPINPYPIFMQNFKKRVP